MLLQRDGGDALSLILVRVEPFQVRRNKVQVRLRLLQRDAGFHTGEHAQGMRSAHPRRRRRGQTHRPEQVEPISRVIVGRLADEREVARQHADHIIRRAIQRHCRAHDIGATAEVSLPCGVAEDHNVVAPRAVLFGEEVAAEFHARAEE